MCGLFGACGPSLSAKDRNAVITLGELTKVRGKDSTGLFVGYRPTSGKTGSFKFKTYRSLEESPKFLASKPVKALLDDEPFVIGGHCRFATHGKVNLSNAHPFTVGHFIGMHNGVIAKLYDRVNDKTDSRVLFENMMKKGVIEGIQSGQSGDMALVFINKSNGTLNYYHNDERPLWIGIEEKKKKFFWASQRDFLEFLQKNRLVNFATIYHVQPHILHSISLKNMRIDTTEIEKPKRTTYSYMDHWGGYGNSNTSVPVVYPVGTKPGSSVLNKAGDSYARKMFPCLAKIVDAEVRPAVALGAREKPLVITKHQEDVSDHKTFFRGFNGELWDCMAAAQIIIGKDSACECCGVRPTSLAQKIFFLSRKSYLCEDCGTDERVKELAYDGITYHMGCLVNKHNVPCVRRIREEEEAAIQAAIPF